MGIGLQGEMGTVKTHRPGRVSSLALSLVLFSSLGAVAAAPARAAVEPAVFENCLLDRANEARSKAGVADLEMAHDIIAPVREWSEWMRFNEFKHMLDSRHREILPDSSTRWGENVAMISSQDIPDCGQIHDMWMNSAGHRANILNPKFRFVAIGAYVDSSGWWVTQLFFDATDYPTSCQGSFCDDDGSVFEDDIESIARAEITKGCNPPLNDRFCPDEPVTRETMAAFLARAVGLPEGHYVDFQDVSGSIFADQILSLAGAEITKGCNPPTNNRFCPDDYVTRGQMAAFLARALDLGPGDGVDFADDNRSSFEADIEALAAAGITTGCNPPSNTRFCPNDIVTRGQMAAFLARALDL